MTYRVIRKHWFVRIRKRESFRREDARKDHKYDCSVSFTDKSGKCRRHDPKLPVGLAEKKPSISESGSHIAFVLLCSMDCHSIAGFEMYSGVTESWDG